MSRGDVRLKTRASAVTFVDFTATQIYTPTFYICISVAIAN